MLRSTPNCWLFVLTVLTASVEISAQAPTALPDSFSVRPGLVLDVAAPGVLANDTGRPGDSLVAVLAEPPASGALVWRPDGAFEFDAQDALPGLQLFRYAAHVQHTETLVVDTLRSVVSLSADVDTPIGSDDAAGESRIAGMVSLDAIPNRAPFSFAHVENVQLVLADTVSLSFRFRQLGVTLGRLEVVSRPDSIALDLSASGEPAAVGDSTFVQSPNKVRLSGAVQLSGTDLLDPLIPDEPQTFDTETDFDVVGVLAQRNDSLFLTLPVRFSGSFELSGVAVDLVIDGTVVASGPLLPVLASAPTDVRINVDPEAVDLAADGRPVAFSLLGAYPNPFSSHVAVRLNIERPSRATVTLSDALGRRVSTLESGWLVRGPHELILSNLDLAPGVYLIEVITDAHRAVVPLVTVH